VTCGPRPDPSRALAAGTHEVLSGGGRGGWLAESGKHSIAWRKSAASNSGGCVEVAVHNGSVLVRDSMNPVGAVLEFSPTAWSAFLAFARAIQLSARYRLVHPDHL
jgi:hypothetical protein